MRMHTIKRRMRLADLSIRSINLLYNLMRGVSDMSTEIGEENNGLWVTAVRSALNGTLVEKRAKKLKSIF